MWKCNAVYATTRTAVSSSACVERGYNLNYTAGDSLRWIYRCITEVQYIKQTALISYWNMHSEIVWPCLMNMFYPHVASQFVPVVCSGRQYPLLFAPVSIVKAKVYLSKSLISPRRWTLVVEHILSLIRRVTLQIELLRGGPAGNRPSLHYSPLYKQRP